MDADIDPNRLLAHPWRPVDARYRLAREIVCRGQLASFRYGSTVVQLVKLLRRLSLCQTESDERQLLIDMPAIYLAMELHESASISVRSTLEARILAEEPVDVIAKKMHMMTSVIKTYAEIFFDVVDRRECLDFVVERVIGRLDPSSSDAHADAALKKAVAYFGGAQALDAYLYPGAASNKSGLARLEEAAGLWARGRTQTGAVLALERLRAGDPASARELFQIFRVQESTNVEEQTSTLDRHVAAMLAELPWTTGKSAREILPAELVELDDQAAELHDDELMLLAAGQRDPEAMAEISELSSRTLGSDRSSAAMTP